MTVARGGLGALWNAPRAALRHCLGGGASELAGGTVRQLHHAVGCYNVPGLAPSDITPSIRAPAHRKGEGATGELTASAVTGSGNDLPVAKARVVRATPADSPSRLAKQAKNRRSKTNGIHNHVATTDGNLRHFTHAWTTSPLRKPYLSRIRLPHGMIVLLFFRYFSNRITAKNNIFP